MDQPEPVRPQDAPAWDGQSSHEFTLYGIPSVTSIRRTSTGPPPYWSSSNGWSRVVSRAWMCSDCGQVTPSSEVRSRAKAVRHNRRMWLLG